MKKLFILALVYLNLYSMPVEAPEGGMSGGHEAGNGEEGGGDSHSSHHHHHHNDSSSSISIENSSQRSLNTTTTLSSKTSNNLSLDNSFTRTISKPSITIDSALLSLFLNAENNNTNDNEQLVFYAPPVVINPLPPSSIWTLEDMEKSIYKTLVSSSGYGEDETKSLFRINLDVLKQKLNDSSPVNYAQQKEFIMRHRISAPRLLFNFARWLYAHPSRFIRYNEVNQSVIVFSADGEFALPLSYLAVAPVELQHQVFKVYMKVGTDSHGKDEWEQRDFREGTVVIDPVTRSHQYQSFDSMKKEQLQKLIKETGDLSLKPSSLTKDQMVEVLKNNYLHPRSFIMLKKSLGNNI